MSPASLLLLAALSAAPLAAADTAQPASAPRQTTDANVFVVQSGPAQEPFVLLTPEDNNNLAGDQDAICYKIRAYIFKRDDDHPPELKGSTTCGPLQPRAENVVWPKARLVPAD